MKKVLFIVFAVIMCILPLAANVSAVTVPETAQAIYTVGSDEGFAGDEVEIVVSFKTAESFKDLGVSEFKSDVLTYEGYQISSSLQTAFSATGFNIVYFDDDPSKMALVATAGAMISGGYDDSILTLTYTINENAQPGEYEITANASDKTGPGLEYFLIPGTITVKGQDFTGLSFADDTVEYDGELHNIEVTGVPSGATVTYTVDGDEFNGTEKAGTYEITATVTAPGYNKWEKTATLEITKKNLTVNVVVPAKEYDGTTTIDNYADYVSMTGLIDGDDVELNIGELHYDIPDAVVMQNVIGNVGVNGSDLGNYEVTYNRPQVAITQKPIIVKADDVIVRVGADMPTEYTYTPEGLVEGDTLREVKVTVSSKANTNTVKEYPITVTVDANYNRNYKITTEKGTFKVIAKDEQEVNIPTVEDVTYGDDIFNIGVTLGNNVSAFDVEYESLTPATVSVDNEGNVTILAAGSAKIAVAKAGDEIYDEVNKTVSFTVAKKPITVTAKDVTVIKDDALPSKAELEYTVEGLVNGDEKADVFTGQLTTTATNSSTVKDYPITKGTLKANANYTMTFVPGTLSVVDKKAQNITVTPNVPANLTYGDAGFKIDVAYGALVTGAPTTFVSSDEEVVTVDNDGNVTVIGAGDAVITVSKAGTDTIADFNEEIDITVAKKKITITAVDNHKKQGNDDPELTYVVTGKLVGNDVISGNVAREDGEAAGTYIIGPGNLNVSNFENYDVNFIGGRFTIYVKTPQLAGITRTFSKTYGDAFNLGVTFVENVTFSTVSYTSLTPDLASVDTEGNVTLLGVGTAKISVTKAGNEDYADVNETVTVNVAKKVITVTAVAKEKYVDQETPELTYTYSPELVGDDEFSGELYVNDKNVAGKKYDITKGTLTLGDNYTITYVSAKLEVLPKVDQTITLGELDVATYGDTGIVLEVIFGDYNTEESAVFASDNQAVATVDGEGNITIVGAGSASISVTVAGNYKYNDFEDDVNLIVDKADVHFKIHGDSKRVGTDDPEEFGYTCSGTLYGDTQIVGKPEREAGDAVGEYDIKPGTLNVSDPQNYNVTYTWGVFNILAKNPHENFTVEGLSETVTYGDTGYAITAVSQDVPGALVTYSSDNAEVISVAENGAVTVGKAGTATVTVTIGGGEDYEDATHEIHVTVNKKPILVESLDLVNKTAVFNGVLEADVSEVTLDFNKLTVVPEDVEEGESAANYVVSGFELVGAKASNYALGNESVLVPISEEIALASVTVVAENGTVEGAGTYLAGSTVTLKATANRNYKFGGWYAGEEEVSSDAEYTFTANADVELTAKFTKSGGFGGGGGGTPKRTVYFQIDETTTNTVTVDKGAKVTKPEDPVREGYTFAGWFTDEAYTQEYDFEKAVDMSFTLYAKWTEVEKQPDDGKEENPDDEEKPTVWENPYKDVPEKEWFYEAVKTVTQAGLMNGVAEDEFAPGMTVTRGMIVTMLYRAEGMPVVINDLAFEDVDEEMYYAGAVAWANENGIVNGYNETEFAPEESVTREQIATIVFRYAVYKGIEAIELSENLFFDDADKISDYAVAPMNWLVGKGIITGYEDGTVKPQGNATRAEVATMAARILAYFVQ
ncbi:MAG: S-layer homology domain-containing protein [Clostridia bacterium]|nr:S-layer homology domain-containing protein [Clostridia bacterium]